MEFETPPAPGIPAPQTLVAWLREGADRETLVGLLVRRVFVDESLRREIAARMRSAPGETGLPDLRGALETILDVTAPAGGWSEGWDLVSDVAELARSAVGLVGRDPGAVLAFAEYALRRLDEGEEEVGGAFEEWPGFGEALVALEELHAAACGPAGRGGPELARDLFAREVDATGEGYVGVVGRWAAALGWLWEGTAEAGSRDRVAGGNADVLARVLHSEGDGEAAWRLAGEADCSLETWIVLADARAATHPDDAVAVYRRAAGGTWNGSRAGVTPRR